MSFKKISFFYKRVIVILIVCSLVNVLSCKSENKKMVKNHYQGAFETEKEGFIDNNTYRVLLVIPADSHLTKDEIINLCKKRAYVSLKQYLLNNNVKITNNINNKLLRLINQYGNLKQQDSSNTTRKCFYFDIEKERLKKYIDNIK